MSCYLMKLTPQEPYFFGNEKSFQYKGTEIGDARNRYYIAGEPVPAQTTLIGMLRYIMLPHKKADRNYSSTEVKKNNAAVGERSFCYGGENEFGKILKIEPLFLLRGDERLVVTPFDHSMVKENAIRKANREKAKKGAEAQDAKEQAAVNEAQKETDAPTPVLYTPFTEYEDYLNGEKCYPLLKNKDGEKLENGYDVKEGIAHSYMSVEDGTIYTYSDIFATDTRIGINRSHKKEGFFKKDYVALKEGFAFGAYIRLLDGVTPPSGISVVYLGQGKSLFTVQFTPVEDGEEQALERKIAERLDHRVVYCMSDMFLQSDIYAKTRFAVTETKDYRAYTTDAQGHVSKDTKLYKLIRAGSVFVPMNQEEFLGLLDNAQVRVIGYNTVVYKKENA